MTDGDARRYTAGEAADLIGCAHTTVRMHASRLFGARRRPGTGFRLTAPQLEQLRQSIDANRRLAKDDTSQ